MTKRPDPTFEVRFIGKDVSPESVPIRTVSEALSAVQDLASGRDPFETPHVPQSKSIGLVRVRRGSAVYTCVAQDPSGARKNLALVGKALSSPDDESENEHTIVASLKPLDRLSVIARSVGCRLEIIGLNGAPKLLATIEGDSFDKISGRHLVQGETTVVGALQRVGGATEMRCSMLVEGRHGLLYCDVASKELVQRLGQHLYEQIAATGTAVWINRIWRIYKFTVRDFTQPKTDNPLKAIEKLRKAGLRAWDSVSNPETYLRELGS